MRFQPMPLVRRPEPFTHPDWIFEIKWDGFRSLAQIENGRCKLVSRKGNEFKSFPDLNLELRLECRAQNAVIDGEIVCLDETGNSQFTDLLFRRGQPRFYAFDLLSFNGEDLRYLPLEERKHKLRAILPRHGNRLLYSDHIELAGEEFFHLACELDLEGIVAKRKFDPYLLDGSATWFKIKNQNYSQWIGREELFDREREGDPDWRLWNVCTSASDQLIDAHHGRSI
jgi:bifunctional non-homologous end joining protein LigD